MDGLAVISRGLAVGRMASAEPVSYPVETIGITMDVTNPVDIVLAVEDTVDIGVEVE